MTGCRLSVRRIRCVLHQPPPRTDRRGCQPAGALLKRHHILVELRHDLAHRRLRLRRRAAWNSAPPVHRGRFRARRAACGSIAADALGFRAIVRRRHDDRDPRIAPIRRRRRWPWWIGSGCRARPSPRHRAPRLPVSRASGPPARRRRIERSIGRDRRVKPHSTSAGVVV